MFKHKKKKEELSEYAQFRSMMDSYNDRIKNKKQIDAYLECEKEVRPLFEDIKKLHKILIDNDICESYGAINNGIRFNNGEFIVRSRDYNWGFYEEPISNIDDIDHCVYVAWKGVFGINQYRYIFAEMKGSLYEKAVSLIDIFNKFSGDVCKHEIIYKNELDRLKAFYRNNRDLVDKYEKIKMNTYKGASDLRDRNPELYDRYTELAAEYINTYTDRCYGECYKMAQDYFGIIFLYE